MTFVAEWGDRSQITTIVLAASENLYGVIIGGVLGHAICTGIAVIGGRLIATKISVRTVTIIGGIVFLIFAITSSIWDPTKEAQNLNESSGNLYMKAKFNKFGLIWRFWFITIKIFPRHAITRYTAIKSSYRISLINFNIDANLLDAWIYWSASEIRGNL